jgi:hypothetical protein
MQLFPLIDGGERPDEGVGIPPLKKAQGWGKHQFGSTKGGPAPKYYAGEWPDVEDLAFATK